MDAKLLERCRLSLLDAGADCVVSLQITGALLLIWDVGTDRRAALELAQQIGLVREREGVTWLFPRIE